MSRRGDGHMPRRRVQILSRLHAAVYRLTGGLVGRRLVHNDMLLLTTTGRRSGRPHTIPLLFLREEDSLVLIASFGGRPNHPDWYRNLTENPHATVQVGGRRIPVRARTASPAERERLWPKVLDAYDGYRRYQERTDRRIPVVLLDGE